MDADGDLGFLGQENEADSMSECRSAQYTLDDASTQKPGVSAFLRVLGVQKDVRKPRLRTLVLAV